MGKGKLQCNGGKRYGELIAECLDGSHAFNDTDWGSMVIVAKRAVPLHACCKDARVVGATDDDRGARFFATGEERGVRTLLQEGVAAGQEDHVERRTIHYP